MTNDLPGMLDKSDLTGGQTDCDREMQEKMRKEFAAWAFDPLSDGYPLRNPHDAWQAWQACAARSAETIARLEKDKAANYTVANMNEVARQKAEKQLAAAQADNARLRDALRYYANSAELGGNMIHASRSIASKALAHPLDTSALDAYVAKEKAALQATIASLMQGKMISVDVALPDYLEGEDYSANVIGRLDTGSLVIANRQYVDDAGGWIWGVAYGACPGLEDAEPYLDDDYKIVEWMPLPPAPDKQGE